MPTVETKLHRDGLLAAIGGQDSGRNPSLLHPTQYALGVNVMCRGGYLETRYGLKPRPLVFENDEQEEWFQENLFQGGDFFAPIPRYAMFVCSVGGRIFKIDVLNDYQVTEITPVRSTATVGNFISPGTGDSITVSVSDNSTIHVGFPLTISSGRYMVTAKGFSDVTLTNLDAIPGVNVLSGTPVYYLNPNPSLLPRIWTLQAEGYFLIQNGSDACIIYDGVTCRRAVRAGTTLEVPTGTAMCYANKRIHVAVNRKEIALGDIYGGPTTIIDFTETIYLAEGGKFRVPEDITALVVAPVLDTSLGQGPVQIHTAKGVYTLNLPVDRLRWKDLTQPVQMVSLVNYGGLSAYGTVIVNGDSFFRSPDGLRSFIMARRDFGTWGNVPISREMTGIIRSDEPKFLQYSSAVLFDNLLFFTVNPLPIESGRSAYWQGLGVLDFDLISSIGQRSPPVYPGVWTGVNVMQVTKGTFDGTERCFAFVRSDEGLNELWEVDPNNRFDGECGRIVSRVETRAMDFGMPKGFHELFAGELWVDEVHGEVDFTLQFRKDQHPCWVDWTAEPQQVCAVIRECEVPEGECFNFKTFQPGYKTRIGFGTPPDAVEDFSESPARLGYEHEFAIQWEGHARVKAFIVKAVEKTDAAAADT